MSFFADFGPKPQYNVPVKIFQMRKTIFFEKWEIRKKSQKCEHHHIILSIFSCFLCFGFSSLSKLLRWLVIFRAVSKLWFYVHFILIILTSEWIQTGKFFFYFRPTKNIWKLWKTHSWCPFLLQTNHSKQNCFESLNM